MDFYIPLAIAPSQVTASTVPEPDAGLGEVAWVAAERVVEGDLRVSTSTHKIHRVKTGGAPGSKRFTGVTMRQVSASSPGLITFTAAHGLAVDDLVAFTVGTLAGAVLINTTYQVQAVPTSTTIYIKVVSGSSSIAPSGSGVATGLTLVSKFVQTVYDPSIAAASGQDIWEDAAWTNRFKALDGYANTPTLKSTSASWTIQLTASQVVNAIAVLNMVGVSSVQVQVYNGATLVQTVTQNTSAGTIPNWQNYFYFSTDSYDSAYFSGLTPIAGGKLVLTFNGAANMSIGEIFPGYALSIGEAQYGAQGGNTDFSVKDTNSLGGTYLNQRAYAKRLNVTLWLTKAETNRVKRLLDAYRATPAVWVLSPDPDYLGVGLLYGWYADFNIEIAYPIANLCSIELKGLT